MESVNSIVVWIFINTLLPLSPIFASFLFGNLFSENFKNLKWYQFLSRNDGLALYSSLISISSLSTPILSSLSTPNFINSINRKQQTSFIYLFIILVLIFILSVMTYAVLLYRSTTTANLYSPENGLVEEQEKQIAYLIVGLALGATVFSLLMKFTIEGL